MHLLIFKVNHLGDNVVFLPVVQQLRRRFPSWRLTVVTAPHVAPLYAADVPAEDLLVVDPQTLKTAWRRPWEFASWASRLKKRHFDWSLVSYDQGSVAHALARVAGGPVRVGAAGLRIRLRHTLTHEVALAPNWNMAQWNWAMARALLTALGQEKSWPAEPPPPDLRHLTGGVRPESGRVLIHAGSKQRHTRWPLERFAVLAAVLSQNQAVTWIDTPETADVSLPASVERLATRSLRDLSAQLARAELFVGNNSGPMHLASALGLRGVVVSGPSAYAWDPAWHRERFRILRTPGLACLPCEQGPFSPGRCVNLDEPMACMNRWSLESIIAACRETLAGAVPSR